LKLGYESCHSARKISDDDGADDGVNVADDGDDGTGVDGDVEGLDDVERDKETSGDYDASEYLGNAVQTDLTSMCIRKLEQNVVLVEIKIDI